MKKIKWWGWALIVVGVLVVVIFFIFFRPFGKDIDPNNPPQFIKADFVDLSKITSISKFRSINGHSYSDSFETCRSMKHVFNPNLPAGGYATKEEKDKASEQQPDPATGIAIYSPVDGLIGSITGEQTPIGRQIQIRVDGYPGYNVILFHVYPVDGIHWFTKVKAGQLIGYLNEHQGTDIAVKYHFQGKIHDLSYFSVMPDNIFAKYIVRGAKSRDDFMISKEYRDTNPLECQKGSDVYVLDYQTAVSGQTVPDEFHLSGFFDPNTVNKNEKKK